jgi:ABC-type dipeptide/oligopeptide/nickel transport system permease subunit
MLRFTIRDVLWLTLVVAMGVGWWTSYWRVVDQHVRSESERVSRLFRDQYERHHPEP